MLGRAIRSVSEKSAKDLIWSLFVRRYIGPTLMAEIPFTFADVRVRSRLMSFKTAPMSGDVKIADLGVEPLVFEAGGLERAIRIQRLPTAMTTRRLTLRRKIRIRQKGDTRLFVRIQQEDGHRMWSSPIYLFRN